MRKLVSCICTAALLLSVALPANIWKAKADPVDGGQSVNLALNKSVTVSSYNGSDQTGDKAVDGDQNTRWSSSYASPIDPQSFEVDLGAIYSINQVKLFWEYSRAKDYTIQFSTDNVNWTQGYEMTDAPTPAQDARTEDDDAVASLPARFVKISMTARSTIYTYSLFEVEVYGAPVPVNLALNKNVTVSSVQGNSYTGDKAVDGDQNTRWASSYASPIDPQSFEVDLGAVYSIDQVKLFWEYSRAKDYTIQLSTDDVNWMQGYGMTDAPTPAQDARTEDDDAIASLPARYVKISMTARSTIYTYSLFEVEVYGSAVPVNLALGKSASASSTADGSSPANAADGDASGTQWVSGAAGAQWYEIDLGARFNIDEVTLLWGDARARDYAVQISTDGASWTDMASQNGVDPGQTADDNIFAKTAARYVRVNMTAEEDGQSGYSLLEMQIYGDNAALLNEDAFVDDLQNYGKMFAYAQNADSSPLFGQNGPGTSFDNDSSLIYAGADNTSSWFTYHLDTDITSFVCQANYWASKVSFTGSPITAEVSADGISYEPLSLNAEQNPLSLSADWPMVVFSSFSVPAGMHYIRITLPATDPCWALQVGRVLINSSTAPVNADPGSSSFDDVQGAVTLSCPTSGAKIYYYTDKDSTQRPYAGPITLNGHTVLTTWAERDGLLASPVRQYTYSTQADQRIDRYGQVAAASYDGKVTKDDELKADVAADAAYYGGLQTAERDQYGGLPGSKEKYNLTAKGFFYTQKLSDGKFVMVDPIGNAYFSLGVNGVGSAGDTFTDTSGRQSAYKWLPKYTTDPSDPDSAYSPAFLDGNSNYFSFYVANKIRKDGSFNYTDYYKECVGRLKALGFTSEGGFSNPPADAANDTGFAQVRFADLPKQDIISGTGLLDVYKPGIVADLDQAFEQEGIAAEADNPLIIGYFFTNEIQYQLMKSTFASSKASDVATKGALVDYLQAEYGGIAAFNTAWGASFDSFDSMREQALSITTDAAAADMNGFMAQYLDQFYKTVTTEFRKYDPNHLMMGDRYLVTPMDNDDLRDMICAAAGKYLDVLSYNYYTYGFDSARIKSMAQISGKPILFTEYGYTEPSEGLETGSIYVDNQTEKGEAYRNYVEQAAATGVVVGAQWFELTDQSATGRWFQGVNGEDRAYGLFNVVDRPYKDMLTSVLAANNEIYDVELDGQTPYSYDFGPGKGDRELHNTVNIAKASSAVVIDGKKDASWPTSGQDIAIDDNCRINGSKIDGFGADVSFAWDDTNLYLYAHVKDATPMINSFTGADIWNGDAIELFVGPQNIDTGGSLKLTDTQLILSAGTDSGYQYHWYNDKQTQPALTMAVQKDADGGGYTMEAAIPLEGLGLTGATANRKLLLDVGVDNADTNQRSQQYMWNGTANNNASRSHWGTATLLGAESSGNTGNTGNTAPADVQITGTTTGSGASAVSVASISAAQADPSATANLNVTLGQVTVTAPASALSAAFGGDSTANLQFSQAAAPASTQSTAALAAAGVNANAVTVLDINLRRISADGTETAVHQLGGSVSVTVRLTPEQLAAVTDSSKAHLYFYDPDTGALTDMHAAFDLAAGTVTFTTDHFSTYVVATEKAAAAVGVSYRAHVQRSGWLAEAADGAVGGTVGKALRAEAVRIRLTGELPAGAKVTYQSYVQKLGWLPAVSNGAAAGTTGKALRLEALRITLSGLPGYAVQYRAHVQGKGWLAWQTAANGTALASAGTAGTMGKALRLEALEVRIVKIS